MVEQEKIAMMIMIKRLLLKMFGTGLLALCMLAVTAGMAMASVAEFYLRAAATDVTMPGPTVVKMWGFASCDNTWVCGSVTIPGPPLTVPPGDTLKINLKNDLTVPISLVIPGQSITPTPVIPDGRVMSFTTETLPTATGIYTWNPLKPGTYIYQSGTNPAVQVQMGLYGALKHDAANLNAYNVASTAYVNEVTLLFSEVDPTLHAAIDAAVTAGDWGTADFPSTIDFLPKYFLINGKPFTTIPSLPDICAGTGAGQTTLLRFLNAGLKDYVPLLQGLYMTILAEDGNLLPYSKSQYTVVLPAGKTIDAKITTAIGRFPIYDRRLNLTNAQVPSGGMLTYLLVPAGACPASFAAATLGPSITVTAPDGGEAWKRGTKRLITWTYTGNPGASVKIQLLRDGVLKQTIVSSKSKGTGGSGSYNWSIPSKTATGGGYAVRITSTANSAYTDTSNTTFTITP